MKIKSKILASFLLLGVISTPIVANAAPSYKSTYYFKVPSSTKFQAWTEATGARGYGWADTYADSKVTSVSASVQRIVGSTVLEDISDSGRYWAEAQLLTSLPTVTINAFTQGYGATVRHDSNLGISLYNCNL
ncbi:MAG: hypothetical protein E7A88_02775 [Dermabacter sp.]|jgi:hypothetical protein|nr:hypothetical protein [Dermabacter sp.]MDU1476637.1 hypothetical protein [Clostridium perfringens]